MNILGVGPAELAVIIVLMLVVAGPKRMIQWAYQAGRYAAMMRKMFQETMDAIQKEIDDSGLDVRKDLRSGFNVIDEASKVINSEADTRTPTVPPVDTTSGTATDEEEDKPRYDAWTPR